jgi:hypothetical protein
VEKDKRIGSEPIPTNVKDYLNQEQLEVLNKIDSFGWNIKFIRRPVFQEPVVVITNKEGNSIGVLETDGRINLELDINIRE